METALWNDPDLKAAPAAFRSALRLAAENWEAGSVTFVLPTGKPLTVEGRRPGPAAMIRINDYHFIRRAFSSGDIGFAEGFMAGEWETPDLSAVLEAFSLNFDKLSGLASGNPLMRALNHLYHLFHRNSRSGSRRNIHAHYDLGNAFYSRWLDPTMTYSSALYEHPDQPLPEAQRAKYAALARTIDLAPGKHVLEIGCGWGGFAEFAAREIGAQVTGLTISKEQYDFARRRLFNAGLSDRATVDLMDYRDVQGRFDRVASIEMFEAVGKEYWPAYFGKIHEVLNPGGRAGLQIITIQEPLFDEYNARTDFIQKYVFPGGMLPSEERLKPVVAAAGLNWGPIERFGLDYAETLKLWDDRFQAAWSDIRRVTGFDERFRRLWRFYLAYCEAGFRSRRTDVVQLVLDRA